MAKNTLTLKEYSALGISLLVISNSSHGQVIYTDIEPDSILEYSGGVLGIDMDNDGTFDFAFKNTVFSIYSTLYHTSFRYERILAGPVYTPLNLIAGSKQIYGNSYAGSYYVYFPYALEEGAIITPPALHFQNWGFQRMAFANYTYSPWLGWTTWNGGLWFPEKIEHFVGVRFIDNDSLYHHGWIRCSVIDSGHTLIIHDYAYESQPNHPIAAGSLETYVGTDENHPDYSVYSFGKRIYLHLPPESIGAEIIVFDVTGKALFSSKITETYTTVSPQCPTGIYIVCINTQTETITKKVILQK